MDDCVLYTKLVNTFEPYAELILPKKKRVDKEKKKSSKILLCQSTFDFVGP